MRKPPRAARLLLDWYAAARRDLPWRRTRDPWAVLVSEIMLQQTRVAAALPYYERFLARFPAPASLAEAAEDELLALWSGLGYYSRARNLKRAAEAIVSRKSFPQTKEEWAQLPGVGDYTAAAVASICFGEPCAVLDGNVARVMARFAAEPGDIAAASTRLRLKELAQSLLDPARPGDFNQALMELGATLCLPRNPKCLLCPWRDLCQAHRRGLVPDLPVRRGRRDPVRLQLKLAAIVKDGRILLGRRADGARRLAGFWELPSLDSLPSARALRLLGSFRHWITHHDYTVEVWQAQIRRPPEGCAWHCLASLSSLPVTSMTRKAVALLPGAYPGDR